MVELTHYSKDIQKFLETFREGSVPSLSLQKWFTEMRGLPARTFQWFMQEGLIPRPSGVSKDRRVHSYTKDEAMIVYDLIFIQRAVKEHTPVKPSTVQAILKKFNYGRGITDHLMNLVQEYPVAKYDEQGEIISYSQFCKIVWVRALQQLERGMDYKKQRFVDVEEQVKKELTAKH